MKKFFFIIIAIFLAILLIINYQTVRQSVINSLLICGNSIIPSLLPIGFLSTLLVSSGALSSASSRFSIHILFIVSQTAGYPVGSLLLNNAVREDLIDKKYAKKILPAFICAGPSFIISFVGEQMFSNKTVGVYLYLSQILANFLIFILLKNKEIKIKKTDNFSIANKLSEAVRNSAISVMSICTYIVLFFAIKPLFEKIFGSQITKYIIYFSEVSSAVLTSKNVYITCSVLAFGGLCVMLQIKSVTSDIEISILRVLKWRVAAILISLAVLKFLLILRPIKFSVYSNLNINPTVTFGGNIGFIVTLFFSIFVMLLSFRNKAKGKILQDII